MRCPRLLRYGVRRLPRVRCGGMGIRLIGNAVDRHVISSAPVLEERLSRVPAAELPERHVQRRTGAHLRDMRSDVKDVDAFVEDQKKHKGLNRQYVTQLMHSCAKDARLADAEKLWQLCWSKGRLEAQHYGAVMQACMSAQQPGKCLAYFEHAVTAKVEPTPPMLTLLVQCLGHMSRWKALQAVVRKSLERNAVSTQMWNTYLRFGLRLGKWDARRYGDWLAQMADNGISPDTHTMNILVKALCEMDLLEEALELSNRMDHDHPAVSLDVFTVTALLEGCAERGTDAAMALSLRMVDRMTDRDIRPDAVLVSCLVKGWLRHGTLSQTLQAVQHITRRTGVPLGPAVATMLLRACKGQPEAEQKVRKLLGEEGVSKRNASSFVGSSRSRSGSSSRGGGSSSRGGSRGGKKG